MRHEIKIPRKIKVGGHDYRVQMGKEVSADLQDRTYRGTHSDYRRIIKLDGSLRPQEISSTFIHEVTHAIDVINCNARLSEDDIRGVATGWHQVLEKFGVRFIK